MKTGHVIGAVALAGVALAATRLAFGATVSPYEQLPERVRMVINPRIPQASQLARFVDSGPGRLAGRPKWTAYTGQVGLRAVPIRECVRTPFASGQTRSVISISRNADAARFFAEALRNTADALAACGRGEEDPRCTFWLHCQETGGGMRCWNNNRGNRKITPRATRESITGSQTVYVENPNCSHVWLLLDNAASFDAYPGYDNPEQQFIDEKRYFDAHAHDLYPGLLDAYRRGGITGCVEAERIRWRGNYSGDADNPGAWPFKERDNRSYWAYGAVAGGAFWAELEGRFPS